MKSFLMTGFLVLSLLTAIGAALVWANGNSRPSVRSEPLNCQLFSGKVVCVDTTLDGKTTCLPLNEGIVYCTTVEQAEEFQRSATSLT